MSLISGFAVLVLGSLGATVAPLGCATEPGESEDPCKAATCQNGGTCTASGAGYTCACAPGWTGENCDVNIDECSPNPCQNGGTCTASGAEYTCACAPGWTGENCDVNIDECSPNPCQNGGICTDGVGAFTCECPSGFSGETCETCVPTTCADQGVKCGTIPDGCGGTLTCGGSCADACPCDGQPFWENALAGMLVTTGPCLGYSFPGPCGSQPDHSWAFSAYGGNVVRLIGGSEESMLGKDNFCGVQVHDPNSCGGKTIDSMNNLTPVQAASCRAEILSFAAAQGGVCNGQP